SSLGCIRTSAATPSGAGPAMTMEVGAGHGLNFACYPTEVTQVVAAESEPHLCELARGVAKRAPVPVEVRTGTSGALHARPQGGRSRRTRCVFSSSTPARAAV